MFRKKTIRFLPSLIIILGYFLIISSVYGKDSSLQTQLLDHAGKTYTEAQDPSFLNYDLALREYMVDRISKRFGVSLDPKIYSGFDLLEIEAFLSAKTEEPF
jgi:hypothetical protein